MHSTNSAVKFNDTKNGTVRHLVSMEPSLFIEQIRSCKTSRTVSFLKILRVFLLACVAGVRKGRGRELGRETTRVSLAPKTPFPKAPFPFRFKRLPRRLYFCNIKGSHDDDKGTQNTRIQQLKGVSYISQLNSRWLPYAIPLDVFRRVVGSVVF